MPTKLSQRPAIFSGWRTLTKPTRLVLFVLAALMFGCAGPYPSLWKSHDAKLQQKLESGLEREFGQAFRAAVKEKRLGITLVDITDLHHPRVAQINGDVMLYAASLPKLAILLGAFVEIERGNMTLDDETREALTRMIRESSNQDATRILQRIGFENLAEILQSKQYRLYDPAHNGGLWVGQDYGGGEEWQRDPLHGISHGATAMQTARFYYLAVTGRLVAPDLADDFFAILADPGIRHKFVRGLQRENPDAEIYRKSGTWKRFHADSGLVVDDRYTYILAGIAEDRRGEKDLQRLIQMVDEIMRQRYEKQP